ncbi:hypothetical protein PO909_031581 [Leuciscus waleckii]
MSRNAHKQVAPDVSVRSSSVSGHEGDNVSVQCFYTSGYKYKLKQWCRYKDKGCYTEKRTDTSQNSSVQISDDGRSSFTVLMTGLRLSDSGWYLCSVGDLQAPVQLTVNEPKPARKRLGYDCNFGSLKRERALRRIDAMGNALRDDVLKHM